MGRQGAAQGVLEDRGPTPNRWRGANTMNAMIEGVAPAAADS